MNKGTKCLNFLLLCMIIVGCSIKEIPPDNVDFRRAQSLKEFAGAFKNLGDTDSERTQPVYLSAMIWPPSAAIAHGSITSIEVLAADEDTLIVRALRDGVMEKESSFVRGKDFHVQDGRIRLSLKWNLLNSGADDPLVGPRYEKSELGIDARGDGKYRNRGAFIGLAFMVFPLAMSGVEEVRFLRIENAPH